MAPKENIHYLAKEVPLPLFKKTISKYYVSKLAERLRLVCGSDIYNNEYHTQGSNVEDLVWTCPLLLKDGDALSITVKIKVELDSVTNKRKVELDTMDRWIYTIPLQPEFLKDLHRAWCAALNTAMELLDNKKEGIQLWLPEKTMLSRLGWTEELDSPGEEQRDAARYLMYAIQNDPLGAASAWPRLVPWTNAISMVTPAPQESDSSYDWGDWSEKMGALYLHEMDEQIELPSGTITDGPEI